MSDNKDFFKKQTDSSRVKAAIISEYFPQYCKIISRRHVPQRFGYFDTLTAGLSLCALELYGVAI